MIPAEADESGRASPADPDEQRRRRKSTLNRVITALKAALNHAHDREKVASRDAWAKLKKFRGVDAARLRWLTEAEAKRLMNVANADMRKMMEGGLMTGCRPGELARARARDFDSTSETLLVPDSKTGKPRRVPLTAEGVGLLESWTAGAQPDDLIFTRADGSPWHRVAVIRGMQIASDAAKISPRANFYSLAIHTRPIWYSKVRRCCSSPRRSDTATPAWSRSITATSPRRMLLRLSGRSCRRLESSPIGRSEHSSRDEPRAAGIGASTPAPA